MAAPELCYADLFGATTLAVSATVFYLFETGIGAAGLVKILHDSVSDPTTTPEDFRNLGPAVVTELHAQRQITKWDEDNKAQN